MIFKWTIETIKQMDEYHICKKDYKLKTLWFLFIPIFQIKENYLTHT
jgi:hypothetical protein